MERDVGSLSRSRLIGKPSVSCWFFDTLQIAGKAKRLSWMTACVCNRTVMSFDSESRSDHPT